MSVAARRALYFQYAISAKFKLSPAPSSAKEVDFLLRSFQNIAPVDFFRVSQSKLSAHNPFTQNVTVVFNSSEQPSQVDAFMAPDPDRNATPAQLEQRQSELLAYIRQICGLPRYSFIENDQLYSEGKSMVPFTHKLLPQGHHYSGEYEISESTSNAPFFLLTGNCSAKDVIPYVRHNFQRFHKIEPTFLGTGVSGLKDLLKSIHRARSQSKHEPRDRHGRHDGSRRGRGNRIGGFLRP
ncbi:hypothetical protein JCM33374_g4786 [Metschnikowia sp. JCM 33374]|nr:hypothetical protein JCM33374_g4786 [Metschnikowia sp. JCM 33374]